MVLRKILVPPVMLALCLGGMIAANFYGLAGRVWLAAPLTGLGYPLVAIGVSLPVWGAMIFRRHQTNLTPYKDPGRLVTGGPFRFSRNPMYLGMLLVLIGAAVIYATVMSLFFAAIYFAVANWWYIPFEEHRMAAVFGDAFHAYRAETRRWV